MQAQTLSMLLLGAGVAATSWIGACSSEVTGTTSSTTTANTTSDGGAGGAGGALDTTPSTAIGGCFDALECGLPLVEDGNCNWCESEACPDELAACQASERCMEFSDCADTCAADTACIDDCMMTLPGGFMLHQALVVCTACKDSCSSKNCPMLAYPEVSCPGG